MKGYVFPARDEWVAFVADTTPLFELSKELKAANEGMLLYFVNAEDHGWGFKICVKNELVCDFTTNLDYDMETEEIVVNIVRKIEKESFENLRKEENRAYELLGKYFDENTEIECIQDAHDFTKDMALYFSDWVSYHYVDLEKGEFKKYGEFNNLKLIKVNVDNES